MQASNEARLQKTIEDLRSFRDLGYTDSTIGAEMRDPEHGNQTFINLLRSYLSLTGTRFLSFSQLDNPINRPNTQTSDEAQLRNTIQDLRYFMSQGYTDRTIAEEIEAAARNPESANRTFTHLRESFKRLTGNDFTSFNQLDEAQVIPITPRPTTNESVGGRRKSKKSRKSRKSKKSRKSRKSRRSRK